MSNQNEQPQDVAMQQDSNDTKPVEKQKNPKRVEAGKKGAAARKAKRLANLEKQDQSIDRITRDTESPKITRDTQSARLEVNVYKNYIPLCVMLIGIVGVGIYMSRNKTQPERKQVIQAPVIKQDTDPFEMK